MINIVIVSSSEFGHIVEIYNFSPDLKTQDLMQALSMFRYIWFVFIISSLNYLLIVIINSFDKIVLTVWSMRHCRKGDSLFPFSLA